MSHRYPLAPLVDVREVAREKAESEVVQAARVLEQAQHTEAQLRQQLEATREALTAAGRERLLEAERARMTAQQFQLAEQSRLLAEMQIERLSAELTSAQIVAEKERKSYERALECAVRARQELAVVERHREKFDGAAAIASETRAEEEAAENWLARKHHAKPEAT